MGLGQALAHCYVYEVEQKKGPRRESKPMRRLLEEEKIYEDSDESDDDYTPRRKKAGSEVSATGSRTGQGQAREKGCQGEPAVKVGSYGLWARYRSHLWLKRETI